MTPRLNRKCKTCIKSLDSECQALRTENILSQDKLEKTSVDKIGLENNDKKVNTLSGTPTSSLLLTIFNAMTNF